MKAVKVKKLPLFLKPYFWSYDFGKLDIAKNKRLLIVNILNNGSKPAIDWLFKVYGKTVVKNVFREIPQSEFSRKSLNYWSIIFGIKPKYKTRVEKISIEQVKSSLISEVKKI